MTSDEIAQLKDEVESLRQELLVARTQQSHSELQIRTVINAMPVGLFITGADGTIEASNPYNLGLFRCNYEDLISRNIGELLKTADLKQFFDSNLNFEYCHRKTTPATKFDGEKFAAEIVVKPFLRDLAIHFVVIVEDVTERQRMQQLRDDFFAMISHDFRSPLTSIVLSTEFMELSLERLLEGQAVDKHTKLTQSLQNVKNSSQRMLFLMNDLLELEKLQSAHFSFYFEKIWLNTVVDQAIEEVEPIAKARKVILKKKPAVCQIIADRGRLLQLLANLLSNAIKFSPAGEAVEVAAQIFGNDMVITVSDHGTGVADNYKNVIFDKFQQAPKDPKTSDKISGTGLGLSICKVIAEGHGGNIGVRDRAGGGSIFWVRLPMRLKED